MHLIERRKSIGEKVSAIVLPLDDSARKAAEAADAARQAWRTLGRRTVCRSASKTTSGHRHPGDARRGQTPQPSQPARRRGRGRALRHAGAVVLGKTNVPQLLLVQESDNAIYGTTKTRGIATQPRWFIRW